MVIFKIEQEARNYFIRLSNHKRVVGLMFLLFLYLLYSRESNELNLVSALIQRLISMALLQIMRNAADTLTPVTLELGGKDAFIVCEDVDVPHVCIIATYVGH